MKIRLVRAEFLFHAHGQIGMTKLTVVFFFAIFRTRLKSLLTSIKYFKFKVLWDVPLGRKARRS